MATLINKRTLTVLLSIISICSLISCNKNKEKSTIEISSFSIISKANFSAEITVSSSDTSTLIISEESLISEIKSSISESTESSLESSQEDISSEESSITSSSTNSEVQKSADLPFH